MSTVIFPNYETYSVRETKILTNQGAIFSFYYHCSMHRRRTYNANSCYYRAIDFFIFQNPFEPVLSHCAD